MEELFYTLLIIGLFCIFIGIYIYISYVSSKKLDLLLGDYFPKKEIDSISKLSIHEKLRYGIPVNFYFLLISKSITGFNSFTGNYYRRLEFKEKAEFVYVQIIVRNKKIVEIITFPQ